MLRILSPQIDAFGGVADKIFVQRVVDHLRTNYADTQVKLPSRELRVQEIDEVDLKALVQGGILRARAYGMSHESALAGFVAIMFESAPNFDTHQVLKRILEDESVDPNARVEKLLADITEETWLDLKKDYDAQTWTGR